MARPAVSFDSVVLAAIAREVDALRGGRVVRVGQRAADEVVLDVRRGRDTRTLLCSIHPRWARVHLTTARGTDEALSFVHLLRKRLDRAQVLSVLQPAFERTLTLTLQGEDGTADLVVEIMGRHSNVILVSGGVIAGSLKPVPKAKSSVREVLPGRRYAPPPRDRPTPIELTQESLETLLATDAPLAKHLSAAVLGLSPLMAQELTVRAALDPTGVAKAQKGAARSLWPHLQDLIVTMREGRFAPVLYVDGGEPVAYAPFPLSHLQSMTAVPVTSMSEAVEAVTTGRSAVMRLEETRAALLAAVDAALGKAGRTEAEVSQALVEAEQAQALRERGELLLAYASQVHPGESEVTLPGFDGRPVVIALQPRLSAVENAQKLFKRYGKLRAAHAVLHERLARAQSDRAYLDAVRAMAEQAGESSDLVDLRRELADEGFVRTRRAPPKSTRRAGPRRFSLPTGETVLVGRTNRENDRLTFSLAAPDDLWLHARGVPGAHVILRSGGHTPSPEAIEQAAAIAAYFSQARGAGSVAVDYTLRRYVRKPKGAKPGVVIYERERTIQVRPGVPEPISDS